MKHVLVVVACFMTLAGSGPAQELVWRVTGIPAWDPVNGWRPTGGRQLGYRTIAIGDSDHDGYEDLLTMADGKCMQVSAPGYLGYLWILSGRTGSLIREIQAPFSLAYHYFRSIDRAGDWNGDGTPDYVAGLDDQGLLSADHAEVRSGADDSVLLRTPVFYPDEVLSDLDVDGDGMNDLIVGDEYALGWWGQVRVYSHSGQLLYQLSGSPTATPPLALAACFARIGDVDNDNCDDFVMGCYDTGGYGANVVVSGRTGAYLRICYGELPGDALCYTADNCGDIDLDGYDDFVVSSGANSFSARQTIRVFSSRTGQVLHGWNAPPNVGFSYKISSNGVDLDGDAMPDIVTGTTEPVTPQQRGAVYAYSGRDATQLHRVISQPPFAQIGSWTAILRPPAGQHTGSFAAPDVQSDGWTYPGPGCAYFLGSISVYSGLPRTTRVLGPACPGTLQSTPSLGMQSLGTTGVRIELSHAPPGAPAVLLLGVSTSQYLGIPLPLAVDPLGFPGCFLRTSIEASCLAVTGTIGQDAGYARIDLPHPIPVSGLGVMTLGGQWVVIGSGSEFPGGMTQAITWRR